jgi:hypothetical protein
MPGAGTFAVKHGSACDHLALHPRANFRPNPSTFMPALVAGISVFGRAQDGDGRDTKPGHDELLIPRERNMRQLQ